MNFDICLMLIFAQSSVIRSRLSKHTRTDTEAGEVTQTEVTSEEVTKSYLALKEVLDAVKLKQSTISYEKLRNILLSDARNSDNICSRNEGNIFKSDLIYKSRRKFWVRFMNHDSSKLHHILIEIPCSRIFYGQTRPGQWRWWTMTPSGTGWRGWRP